MRALKLLLVLALTAMTAACGGDDAPPQPTPDPQTLLAEGITQLQDATSFKYEVDVSGYRVAVSVAGLDLPEGAEVSFKYASGTFQMPDRLSARVQFRLGVLSTIAELVALGSTQYFRGELITGNRWLQGEFLPGFEPASLVAQPGGVPHTLSTIRDLSLVGRTDMDGLSVYQVRGRVEAGRIFSLTLGLSRVTTGLLDIDVFIGTQNRRVLRIALVEPPPEWAANSDPTTWQINISEYNAPVSITAPAADGDAS
ncbi:MAG: LppX_LprAFG lipoprotein [Anaerolineae bacterium]|nr:LppX_LprAFG lipoprotein [Anaerolineae bacterium]